MALFEDNLDYIYSSNRVKDICGALVSIFGEVGCVFTKLNEESFTVSYIYNNFSFKFYDVDAFFFSLLVSCEGKVLFNSEFWDNDFTDFTSEMELLLENGFKADTDNIVFFKAVPFEVVMADNLYNEDASVLDEMVDEPIDKPQKTMAPAEQDSIVPDDIRKIRVVALRYKGSVIAFRFKTDKGAFDMGIEVAAKYGLSDFKTETFIPLESINGILMSSNERQMRKCVPDISLCEADCKKLIDAIFSAEE